MESEHPVRRSQRGTQGNPRNSGRVRRAARTARPTPQVRPLRDVAEQWRQSRIDVSGSTTTTHLVNLGRILPRIGDRDVDTLAAAEVSDWVTGLHRDGLARETIRKTKTTLAMVLDFAGRKGDNNPARDKSVKCHARRPMS